MGRTPVTDQQAGFAGGVNITADQAFLRPDQARQMVNFRLAAYGAALKRLGTQIVIPSAITTNDVSGSVNGGIYWPQQATTFITGAATNSTTQTLYSALYAVPTTFSAVGSLPQYRPVIFTDGIYNEVLYWAGDNAAAVYKVTPNYATATLDSIASDSAGAVSNFGWNHNFGTGTNRLLVVRLSIIGTTASQVTIDPFSLNIPLTLFGRFTSGSSTVEVWYVVAPPQAGSKQITVALAGTATSVLGVSMTRFNVDQTNPFEATGFQTASGSSSSQPSLTINGSEQHGNNIIADAVVDAGGGTVAAAGGQTSVAVAGEGASYKTASTAQTVMSWTGATGNWIQAGVAIRPALATSAYTITALPATTKGVSGLCLYNDRLWGWNTYASPNSLFFSELSSIVGSVGGDSLGNTATGGGEIIVRTFGVAAIVACRAVNGNLVIWHQRGISVLTGWGQDDIAVQPQALNADVGMGNATDDGVCVANDLASGDIAYFVTPLGIYATNGATVRPLGTPDKPDPIAALLQNATIQPSQCLLRFNHQFSELWVGVVGVGIYVYHVILQSWSGPFTGTYASGLRQIFQVLDPSGNPHLWRITFSGTPGTGLFVSESDRANTYKDDVSSAGSGGSAVTGTLQLHRMFGGERLLSKAWRWVNILAQLTTSAARPTVIASTQQATSTFTLGTLSSIEQAYYITPGGWGPYLDVTINDAGTHGTSQYAMTTIDGYLLGQR